MKVVDVQIADGPQAQETQAAPQPAGLTLIYDGECPVCKTYVQMLRLREAAGVVTLVNAREAPDLVGDMRKRGFEINEGMILLAGDQVFFGADALNAVALMSTPTRWVNRLNYSLFRSRRLSRLAYPFMRGSRGVLLKLLGRPLID